MLARVAGPVTENETARAELAVAFRVSLLVVTKTRVAGNAVKVMVCGLPTTEKDCCTCGAAA